VHAVGLGRRGRDVVAERIRVYRAEELHGVELTCADKRKHVPPCPDMATTSTKILSTIAWASAPIPARGLAILCRSCCAQPDRGPRRRVLGRDVGRLGVGDVVLDVHDRDALVGYLNTFFARQL
jgi:hypothetical protein